MNYNIPEPKVFPQRVRSSKRKWYAIIVIIILLISSFSILSALHPHPIAPETSIASAGNYVSTGTPYNITIKLNQPPKYVKIFWGDNTNSNISTSGTAITISHIYTNPGIYYIHYFAVFTSGILFPDYYIPVYVSSNYFSNYTTQGILSVYNYSRSPINPDSNIFYPNTNMNISGSFTPPDDPNYSLISGTFYLFKNGNIIKTFNINTYFDHSSKSYVYKNLIFNFNHTAPGNYTMELVTYSGNVSSSGSVSDIISSKYFLDVIITSKIPHIYIDKNMPYIAFASSSPYNNLNPETAYTSGDMQILMNTEEFLFYYNQTSGKYYPNIADYPEIKNDNKTFIFKISNSFKFQNGETVNAYDVYYSLVTDIILDNVTPQSPGWLLAQYVIPGNYYTNVTYNNIKNAISYSNTSNTVTINFTHPMSNETVYRILTSPGAFITSASYMIQHGAVLNITNAGIEKFRSNYEDGNYSYFVNHIISDGPYEILSLNKNAVTLIRNPFFMGTKYNAIPHFDIIKIYYGLSLAGRLQGLRLNALQMASVPYEYSNAFSAINNISISGNVTYSEIYSFNSNVNLTMLGNYGYFNMPYNLFSNITVREAFYNAYPGNNLTLSKHLWDQFVLNAGDKYNIKNSSGVFLYNNATLKIPLFVNSIINDPEVVRYINNLQGVIKGLKVIIIPVTGDKMKSYEFYGNNPMPIYLSLLPLNMNLTEKISYLGNPENGTYMYQNGFSIGLYNKSHKNQTKLMLNLSASINKLTFNYSSKNITDAQENLSMLYLYIFTNENVTITHIHRSSIYGFRYSLNKNYNIITFNTLY